MDRTYSTRITLSNLLHSSTYPQQDAIHSCPALIVLKEDYNNNNTEYPNIQMKTQGANPVSTGEAPSGELSGELSVEYKLICRDLSFSQISLTSSYVHSAFGQIADLTV